MSKSSVTLGHTFKNTCNENAHSKLHGIIHGYIVTVLDIYIYILIMSIYYINTLLGI